ncbi:hypothetical protein B0H13DRAFT_1930031 [Mycena leptocephala]|nr:hypothetical protein B0H13DRAFT_1930031 [Mycena leptocephala]
MTTITPDVAVDVANILIYYFSNVDWLTYGKPFLVGSLAWMGSALSAVLIARLILNMCEVADTDGMAVGDVASEDDTVEWSDIDGTPMEPIRAMAAKAIRAGFRRLANPLNIEFKGLETPWLLTNSRRLLASSEMTSESWGYPEH